MWALPWIFRLFEYQKNPYLNQAAPLKNTCRIIFLTKKNPEIENFNPQKILSVTVTLNLEQGFSQKAVQPSYGRPFLEETQGKFT